MTKVLFLKTCARDGIKYKKGKIYELPLDIADILKAEGYAIEAEDYFGIESVQGVEDKFNQINSELEAKVNNTFYIETQKKSLKNEYAKGLYDTTKGCVVITDDGLRKKVFERVKPLLDQHNIKISFGAEICHIGLNDERGTWEDLQQLYLEGHEIMSHTVNHPDFTNATSAVIEYEFTESKKILLEKGIKVKNFIYPYNSTSSYALNNVLKYYRGAVGLGEGKTFKPPVQQEMIPRTGLGVYQTYSNSTLKTMCTNAYNNGECLVFMTHIGFEEGIYQGEVLIDNVIEIIQHCIDNNIPIVTLDEALDRLGNISQIGTITSAQYEIIGADKKRYSNLPTSTGNLRIFGSELNTLKPPSYFNKFITANNCSTVYMVVGDADKNNPNLPFASEGVLEIEKISASNGFDRQCFRPKGKHGYLIRYSVPETDTWTSWYASDGELTFPASALATNQPPSYFSSNFGIDGGLITITYRFTQNDTSNVNLPIAKVGVIKHFCIGSSGLFDYQMYTSVDGDIWMRTTNNLYYLDTWQSWRSVKPLTGWRSARPTNARIGDVYFDQTIYKPIWWKGDAWVLADGTVSPNS